MTFDIGSLRFEIRFGGHVRWCHQCHDRVDNYMVAVNSNGYVLAVVRLCEKCGGTARCEVMLAARLQRTLELGDRAE
jgi:RNase P subunit RPR2